MGKINRAPRPKAKKGACAKKRNIGRGFHHGKPNTEERAIEKHERQGANKDIRKQRANHEQ